MPFRADGYYWRDMGRPDDVLQADPRFEAAGPTVTLNPIASVRQRILFDGSAADYLFA